MARAAAAAAAVELLRGPTPQITRSCLVNLFHPALSGAQTSEKEAGEAVHTRNPAGLCTGWALPRVAPKAAGGFVCCAEEERNGTTLQVKKWWKPKK